MILIAIQEGGDNPSWYRREESLGDKGIEPICCSREQVKVLGRVTLNPELALRLRYPSVGPWWAFKLDLVFLGEAGLEPSALRRLPAQHPP